MRVGEWWCEDGRGGVRVGEWWCEDGRVVV